LKVYSPWIVAITIAVVIAVNALGLNQSRSGEDVVYLDESIDAASWHRDAPPPDRWVGVVLDETGWERLPAELGVPFDLVGSPSAPDFTREVALVAYMGAMPTGGHSVRIKEVAFAPVRQGGSERGRLAVRIAVNSPGPGDLVTQAFTYPAAVVKIAKEAWPPGALESLSSGSIEVIVVDQDGRDWGPLHVIGTALRPAE